MTCPGQSTIVIRRVEKGRNDHPSKGTVFSPGKTGRATRTYSDLFLAADRLARWQNSAGPTSRMFVSFSMITNPP